MPAQDKLELTIIKDESKVGEETKIGGNCSPKSPIKSKKLILPDNRNEKDIKQEELKLNNENISSLTPKSTNADKTLSPSSKSPKKTKFSFKELPQDVKDKTSESVGLIKKSKTQELSKQLKILAVDDKLDPKFSKDESALKSPEKVPSPKTPKTPKTPKEEPLSPKLLNTSKDQPPTLIQTDNATKKKVKKSKSPNIEPQSPKTPNAEQPQSSQTKINTDDKSAEVNLKKSKSPKVEPKQKIVPVNDEQIKPKSKEKSNKNKSMESECQKTKLTDAKLATKQEIMAVHQRQDPLNNNHTPANENIGVKVLKKTGSKKQKEKATAVEETDVTMMAKKVTSPKLVNENGRFYFVHF